MTHYPRLPNIITMVIISEGGKCHFKDSFLKIMILLLVLSLKCGVVVL